ncbi:MAG: ribonuclease T2 [Pseudomonadota bacterium]
MLLRAALLVAGLATVSLGTVAPALAQNTGKPGDFDYLTLALTWSPTFCADKRNAKERQCSRQRRPYAFVLHGLWPQYEKGWPQFCRTRDKPWVSRKVIDTMLDIMPSRKLVIHQYRKHGVCSGLSAPKFFRLSRLLFEKVKIPRKFTNLSRGLNIATRDVEAAFLRANPKLQPEMISVQCGRGRRLREVRICFNKKGRFRACSINESQRRLCRSRDIYLPPVREGRPDRAQLTGSRVTPG